MRTALTSIGMVLMFTSGCNSHPEKSASTAIAVVHESPTERNLKTDVIDDAIVSGQKQLETVTTTGEGTPGHPIGVDFELGKPEVTESDSEPNERQILYDQYRMIITKGVDGADRIGVVFDWTR